MNLLPSNMLSRLNHAVFVFWCVTWHSHWKTVWRFFKQLKIVLPYNVLMTIESVSTQFVCILFLLWWERNPRPGICWANSLSLGPHPNCQPNIGFYCHFFMCMGILILTACMSCASCVCSEWGRQQRALDPLTGATDGCGVLRGCWALNPGPSGRAVRALSRLASSPAPQRNILKSSMKWGGEG